MPPASTQPDPYRAANFMVEVDGQPIAGVLRVRGLRRETAVIVVREGSDPNSGRLIPGMTRYRPIVLERPRTDDRALEKWADSVSDAHGGHLIRSEMVITLLKADGTPGIRYKLPNCWPSKYVAVDSLDALADRVVMERVVIEHQGWETA